MLMPDEVAVKHDGYLSRFHTTGVKNVIDTTRYVEGSRKDGTRVPLELSVREILDPNGGKSSFVAFARDRSDDGALEVATQLANTIRDMSIVPLVEITPEGTILYANEATLKEFGYPKKSDLEGQNVKMLMPKDVAIKHDGYLDRYKKGHRAGIVGATRRVTGQRADGTLVSLELSLGEFKSEHTGRNFFVGYLLNINQQLELEQANSTVNSITNMSTTAIIAIDGAGTVITFNEAAERDFGYSADEVRGQNIKMLMPREVAERHDGYLKQYAKTKIKNVVDQVVLQRGRRKDGHLFPLELRVKELSSNDSSSMFVGYARNATGDLILERETKLFNVVLNLSSSPIIIMDRKGIVKTMNPAGLKLFGYAQEEVIGHNIKMLMPKRVARMHDRFLSAYISTGVKRVIDNVRRVDAKRKDGTEFPAEISVREIVPTSGNVDDTIYAGFLRDLSEELEVEQRAKINKAVSDLSLHPLIVMTGEGVVQAFSKSASACFGYEPHEVIGRNIKMLMPKETADAHDGYLAAFGGRDGAADINVKRAVTAKRKNGQEFGAKINVRALRVSDGIVADRMLLVGYLEDITLREAYLRDVQITEAAVKLASVPVVSIRTDGTIRSLNSAAEATFNYKEAELVGKNVKILMPDEIAVNHDGFLKRYLETGIKTVIGNRRAISAKRRDGTQFPAVISVHEIKNSADHYYIGYVEDQTQVHNLQTSRAINEAAKNNSSDPFVTMDEFGIILDVNPACELVFGWTRAELVGQNVKKIVAAPHKDRHDMYLDAYRRTGEVKVMNTTTRGLKADRKDGTTTTVDLQVRQVEIEGKRFFIGSFRDTTLASRKQADRAVALAAEKGCVQPLITMTDVGTVLRINQPAIDIFGYDQPSEIIGQNIKMLMPHDVAVQHDMYLRRYKETGVKHVIDTQREVSGLKKNRTHVEVRLWVREVTIDCTKDNAHIDFSLMSGVGKKTIYVALLEDVAQGNLLQLSGVLNEAVMQLLPTPVITITEKGTILTFNKAAEAAFEFEARQVLGRNVNLLMPPEVQKKHDSYLERYKQDGIKRVIDQTREVIGETKSGAKLKLRLQVRELKRPKAGQRSALQSDQQTESVYVGFVTVLDSVEKTASVL
jgi:PAS domain S-box-containing protein